MSISKFFKGFGAVVEGTAKITGEAISGVCDVVADATGAESIKQVGNIAKNSTHQTGRILNNLSIGIGQTTEGLIEDNPAMLDQGLSQMGNTVVDTAKGIGTGLAVTGQKVYQLGDAVINDDMERAKSALKEVAIIGGAAMLSIGILEVAGVTNIVPSDIDTSGFNPEVASVETVGDSINPNTHHVDPHYVSEYTTASGNHVDGYWRDGDGDTSMNLSKEDGGGYMQTNPDEIITNNFSYKGQFIFDLNLEKAHPLMRFFYCYTNIFTQSKQSSFSKMGIMSVNNKMYGNHDEN